MKLPGAIEIALLLAPWVVVPLALRLVPQDRISAVVRRLSPFAAALATASFLLPAGGAAAALAGPWFLVTALLGISGLLRLRGAPNLPGLLFAAAHLFLPVGGAMLVQSRLGLALFGFTEPIILLTAVHFHYTGFAAPILAGRAAARGRAGALAKVAGLGIVGATPLIAAGFMLSKHLQAAAVLAMTLSVWALAALDVAVLPTLSRRPARDLLSVSALAAFAGMALAALYALSELTGAGWIDIPRMSWTHGPVNGLGFVLCGLLAWRLEDA